MEDIGGKKCIMKIKELFFLLLMFCGFSCDVSTPFIIDGKKEYIISGQCGTIKIGGSSMASPLPTIITCTFNGEYNVYLDSLKIEVEPNEVIIENLRFQLHNADFTGNKIVTKGGEILSIHFNLKSSVPYQRATGTILLLPSTFITCKDKPIITDTIRIQLRK